MTKPIWKSKTFWFNTVSGILTGIEVAGVTDMLSAGQQSSLAIGVIVANIILRWLTVQPVTIR